MESIVATLMYRDHMTREEAEDQLKYCRQLVSAGADPEEVLHDELGLEPDYVWELL